MSRLDDELGWRQQLKAGDPVVVASRDDCYDRSVKSETPTRIRTEHLEFTKQDGLEYGAALFARRYLIEPGGKHHQKLLAARKAELARHAFRERRGKLVTRVRSIESPEQLDALEALLDGAGPERRS